MNIIFQPPQLGAARQAETLRRFAQEISPADCVGELRVLNPRHDEPLRVVLLQSGHSPAAIELPRASLYEDHSEYNLRERLAELFQMAVRPALAR